MSEVGRRVGAGSLVGRGHEHAAVLAALDVPSNAVLLIGDAGIGKTAIWEATVAARRAAGDHMLMSRASAAEARLPWVGMTDLLRDVPPALLADLPEPQRRALQAVSLQTAGADAVDERTVGTALLSTLHALADTAPVLLAVDDLPSSTPRAPPPSRSRSGGSPPATGRGSWRRPAGETSRSPCCTACPSSASRSGR